METLIGPEQKQELINIGKEFAFEGIDMRYFKANNAEELRLFKEGYQEGLTIIQQNASKTSEEQEVRKIA